MLDNLIVMKIDFNSIPDAIQLLIEKVDILTAQLTALSQAEKTDTGNLDMDGLISFLKSKGIKLSKSKIYKLCMNRHIPFRKFGNKLVFRCQDIEQWVDVNCKEIQMIDSDSIRAVVMDARRKERRSNYGK